MVEVVEAVGEVAKAGVAKAAAVVVVVAQAGRPVAVRSEVEKMVESLAVAQKEVGMVLAAAVAAEAPLVEAEALAGRMEVGRLAAVAKEAGTAAPAVVAAGWAESAARRCSRSSPDTYRLRS